ncbi:MAG: sugar ABC transporter substrate-binding protein [Granulosicoccus sp.]
MKFVLLARSLVVTSLVTLASTVSIAEELSLEGKTIGVTVVGTSHHWDLQAYQGQIDELERLGAEVIALDAGRNDQTQVNQIQTLITQKPDAIIQQLGNIEVLDPWLKRIRDAGIPLFTVDTITPHSVNNTTSNNYGIGSDLALQMVDDMGGEGKVLVFNGFYSVPVCKIRYDQMKYVMSNFSGIELIEPELKDVAPNTVQQAFADVTDMLTKYDEDSGLKAVWACWDRPSVGATQAIEKAGRTEVKTYGIDGSPDYVEMIADPNSPAAAVAAQQPYKIGKGAAENVAKYLNGQDVPPITFVSSVLINKANAAELAKDFLPAK